MQQGIAWTPPKPDGDLCCLVRSASLLCGRGGGGMLPQWVPHRVLVGSGILGRAGILKTLYCTRCCDSVQRSRVRLFCAVLCRRCLSLFPLKGVFPPELFTDARDEHPRRKCSAVQEHFDAREMRSKMRRENNPSKLHKQLARAHLHEQTRTSTPKQALPAWVGIILLGDSCTRAATYTRVHA